jgi:hypothetical protein
MSTSGRQTSDSEESIQITGSNPSDRTSDVGPGPVDANPVSMNPGDFLPGTENLDSTVNWLGSSYSGVDIKVVAHLYGAVETDRELEDLNNQVAEADAVKNALENFLSDVNGSGLSLAEVRQVYSVNGKEAFLAAGGMDTASIGASAFLAYYSPFVGDPARTLVAMRSDADGYQSIIAGLQETVKAKEELLKKASSTVVLATLQTLSVQTHREKFPVRGLGQSYVKGYTKGPRTIAGTMIFTLFHEHALAQLIRGMSGKGSVYGEDNELSTLIADQLPPIDLTIVFANEYGSLSQMAIYGVEFVNDGMTMSIEDLLTEDVVNFVARDVDVLTSKGNISLSRNQRGMHDKSDTGKELTGTDLLFSSRDSYNKYLDNLHVRRRLRNR